ncbi:hypothetical protein EC991_002434, partial [Linnemannia zychae]
MSEFASDTTTTNSKLNSSNSILGLMNCTHLHTLGLILRYLKTYSFINTERSVAQADRILMEPNSKEL